MGMNNQVRINMALLGFLAGTTIGFSAVPPSIWKTDDTAFYDMWNKKNLDEDFWPHAANWSVKNPNTPEAMIVTDGASRPSGSGGWTNLVWKWQSEPTQPNFAIRFTYHIVVSPSGNTGFNARGHCENGTIANNCGGPSKGYRINGPQIDLGPTYTGDVWNSGAARYASGIDACKLRGTDWQDLEYRVSHDTAYMNYYPNGFDKPKIECSKYKFTAATDVAATSPGLIALQYETTLKVEFKNIQMRNLDARQSVALASRAGTGAVTIAPSQGRAISYTVQGPGHFSVQVRDILGNILQAVHGQGPVASQDLNVGRSGIFLVQVVSAQGSSVRKVFLP